MSDAEKEPTLEKLFRPSSPEPLQSDDLEILRRNTAQLVTFATRCIKRNRKTGYRRITETLEYLQQGKMESRIKTVLANIDRVKKMIPPFDATRFIQKFEALREKISGFVGSLDFRAIDQDPATHITPEIIEKCEELSTTEFSLIVMDLENAVSKIAEVYLEPIFQLAMQIAYEYLERFVESELPEQDRADFLNQKRRLMISKKYFFSADNYISPFGGMKDATAGDASIFVNEEGEEIRRIRININNPPYFEDGGLDETDILQIYVHEILHIFSCASFDEEKDEHGQRMSHIGLSNLGVFPNKTADNLNELITELTAVEICKKFYDKSYHPAIRLSRGKEQLYSYVHLLNRYFELEKISPRESIEFRRIAVYAMLTGNMESLKHFFEGNPTFFQQIQDICT